MFKKSLPLALGATLLAAAFSLSAQADEASVKKAIEAKLGAKVTSENMRAVLGASPENLKAWDEVVALAGEAKERNRVNGQLITERLQNNQQALTTLLAAAEHPQIYGPDGQSRPTASSRNLGSA